MRSHCYALVVLALANACKIVTALPVGEIEKRQSTSPFVTVDGANVHAPYVTVDGNSVEAPFVTTNINNKPRATKPIVELVPIIKATSVAQQAEKRLWCAGPDGTVGPDGVEAPSVTVAYQGDVQAPGVTVSPRQYYEGPYVTVGPHGVEAPGATVTY